MQEFFFRPGEQDRSFFPVKVQRKIFFSQYISRQDPLIITAFSRLSYSYKDFNIAIIRDVAGVFSQRRPRTESQEGPRNFHCALFYMVMS